MNFISTRIFVVTLFCLFAVKGFSQAPVANFTVVDPDGCAPLSVQFNDASTGSSLTYDWNFGDPNAPSGSSQASPSHNYALPGVYTVTLTVTNGNGTDTEVKTNFITVFEGPQASYTTSEDTVCSGIPITFTDNSTPGDGAINQYNWTFNDGSPPVTGVNTVNHPFSVLTPQTFTPVFVVTDANGCNSIFSSNSIYVFPQPTANIAITNVTNCSIPATVTFGNTGQGPPVYNWDFGDPASGANNTSTSGTPVHTYNTSAAFLVTLTVGTTGCSATDTMTVLLQQPTSVFTVSDSTPCRLDQVLFTSTGSTGTLQWTFGDGSLPAVGPNPTHAYINPGTYTVTLTTSIGSCTATSSHSIFVPPIPVSTFTVDDDRACDTSFTTTFHAASVATNVAWDWNFGDGSAHGTTQNPTHTFTSFGNYMVGLVVTDNYGCRDSISIINYIQIIQPTIRLTLPDSGCVGTTFTINSVVTSPADPTVVSYVYDFGDGTPPQTQATSSITHQFNAEGIFNLTLTITTSEGCTATVVSPGHIRVGNKPTAIIDSVFHSICFKDNVSFTNSSPQPITFYQWYFGDGGGSTQPNPSWQYKNDTSATGDPFDITLIVYNNGCPDTDVVLNMVEVKAPIPNFSFAYSCASPNTVTFTNLSGGATNYSWNFGDGSAAAVDVDPVHIFPGRNDYTVILTAANSGNGCHSDSVYQVHIRDLNSVITAAVDSGCHPLPVVFNGTTSQDAVSYMWTFGEGIPNVNDTSNLPGPTHLYNTAGTYITTLTVTDDHGCTKSTTKSTHVLGPTANFTADPLTGCLLPDFRVNFKDSSRVEGSPISQWTWNYGTSEPTETTTNDTISHHYSNAGSFNITLTTVDGNGCSDTHTAISYINPTQPTANILINDSTGCRNTSELINSTAGIAAHPVTYQWDFGDNTTLTDTIGFANHVYTANDRYIIHLIVTDHNGCVDTISRPILVHTTSAQFSTTLTEQCVDSSGIKRALVQAIFHTDSNDYVSHATWAWDFTVFQDSARHDPTYFYNYSQPPGSYPASLVLTNDFGCRDTFVNPDPIVIPGPTGSFSFTPNNGCSPLTVNFTGSSINSTTYSWDFGDGETIVGTGDSILSHTYITPDTNITPQFYLGFQLANDFCYVPAPTAGHITVTSLIDVDILEDTIYVQEGASDTLDVNIQDPTGNGPYTYNWTPANTIAQGTSSNEFIATPPTGLTSYLVSVPYGTQGCAGTDRVFIVVEPCAAGKTIPNVFTPGNDDDKNQYFQIDSLCSTDQFHIKIFNRWGKLIYESADPGFRWDGRTTGGTDASEGVYYYVLTSTAKELHGYIDLIRKQN